jgi:hypothetical protein
MNMSHWSTRLIIGICCLIVLLVIGVVVNGCRNRRQAEKPATVQKAEAPTPAATRIVRATIVGVAKDGITFNVTDGTIDTIPINFDPALSKQYYPMIPGKVIYLKRTIENKEMSFELYDNVAERPKE